MEKENQKTEGEIRNEETTSFVNGSLITDQWFDSSRQKRTTDSGAQRSTNLSRHRERTLCITRKITIANEAYNEAKQTNKQYDYIKLTKAAM